MTVYIQYVKRVFTTIYVTEYVCCIMLSSVVSIDLFVCEEMDGKSYREFGDGILTINNPSFFCVLYFQLFCVDDVVRQSSRLVLCSF